MASSKVLNKGTTDPPFDHPFHYRRIIGMMNYLEKFTRPDIMYAVHQCSRYCEDPKEQHAQAVKWLGRYLRKTKEKGIQWNPDKTGLTAFVDEDFSRNWHAKTAKDDIDTARSRHCFILKYQGILIQWASQLQGMITLRSTESEYVRLSEAIRQILPTMRSIKELSERGFPLQKTKPKVMCTLFKDNSGAIEIENVPKICPWTKHINVLYHHFRIYVSNKTIRIRKIDTEDQQADIGTKPLPVAQFTNLRSRIMGW